MNLYSVPSSVPALTQTLIKTDFVDVFNKWDFDGFLSRFIFSDNLSDYKDENKYGRIFLATWWQNVKKCEKCDEDYLNTLIIPGSPSLGADQFYPKIMNEGIITKIKLFYKWIEIKEDSEDGEERKIEYQGNIITGLQFKDHNHQLISCNYKRIFLNNELPDDLISSDVCGTKNNEERSSWVTIGGPVKGSFAITDRTD